MREGVAYETTVLPLHPQSNGQLQYRGQTFLLHEHPRQQLEINWSKASHMILVV